MGAKKSVASLLIGIMMLSLVSCGSSNDAPSNGQNQTAEPQNHLEEIIANGTLKVGTSAYRPMQYRDDSGNMVGYNADLAYAMAEKMGVEVEWVEIPFASLVAGVQAGQCDIVMASISATVQGAEAVSFTQGYLKSGMKLVVREDCDDINGVEDLEGKVVGVKANAGSDTKARAILEEGKVNFEIKAYDTTEAYLIDLAAGRLDAVINVVSYQVDYNKQYPGQMKIVGDWLTNSEIVMVLQKDDESLRDYANEFLDECRENGTLDELEAKWLTS